MVESATARAAHVRTEGWKNAVVDLHSFGLIPAQFSLNLLANSRGSEATKLVVAIISLMTSAEADGPCHILGQYSRTRTGPSSERIIDEFPFAHAVVRRFQEPSVLNTRFLHELDPKRGDSSADWSKLKVAFLHLKNRKVGEAMSMHRLWFL